MNVQTVDKLKHSPLENYIVPGLTSWLISDPSPRGCVRMFEMLRNQEMAISPHSHRFDFQCVVLEGDVTNTIWRKYKPLALASLEYFSYCNPLMVDERKRIASSDEFQRTELKYLGKPGQYSKSPIKEIEKYYPVVSTYKKGDQYHMTADQIHSIRFSKGAKVLFMEGPNITDTTNILDPYVNGVNVHQSDVLPWMFHSTASHDDHLS